MTPQGAEGCGCVCGRVVATPRIKWARVTSVEVWMFYTPLFCRSNSNLCSFLNTLVKSYYNTKLEIEMKTFKLSIISIY